MLYVPAPTLKCLVLLFSKCLACCSHTLLLAVKAGDFAQSYLSFPVLFVPQRWPGDGKEACVQE